MQKNHTRVKSPKLSRSQSPNCEGLNIFLNEVTVIEYHSCQYTIVKEGDSIIIPNTQDCKVEHDVKVFFKDLNNIRKADANFV